jgi:hypothetical protein
MGRILDRLKFDPKADPNHTYTLAVAGVAWEAGIRVYVPALSYHHSCRPALLQNREREGCRGDEQAALGDAAWGGLLQAAA